MSTKKRTATEVSAVAAITVAVSLAMTGAYIAAAVAALIGIVLFFLYEKLNMATVELDEEIIRHVSQQAQDEIEEAADAMSDKGDR